MNPDDVVASEEQSRGGLSRSIGTRLAVCFSLGFIVVLVLIAWIDIRGVPFTAYSGRQGQQRSEAFKSLDLIADLKKERLQRWLEALRDNAHVFSENDMMKDCLAQLRTVVRQSGLTAEDREEFRTLVRKEECFQRLANYLEQIKRAFGLYDEIQVVDAETELVLVSTNDDAVGSDVSGQLALSGALQSHMPCVGRVELAPGSSVPVLTVRHVVSPPAGETREDKQEHPIGILVMKVDTDDILKPMLHTGEGLGKRGEALLVNQEGMILTSLKHPLADGTAPKPLEHRITSRPTVFAAAGKEALIDDLDYRGEPVLGAYRHVRVTPDRGWGLVVKRDKAELFAPLRESTLYSLSLGLVGILAFIALTIVLAGNLTRPIRSLSQTAEKVAAGDFSARANVFSSDEAGLLGTTFNAMLDRIQNWYRELEDLVRARTAALAGTNEQLQAEIAERKGIEQKREELVADLEAKNAELERFTYTVSHDLKSPLITIKGYLGMLEQDIAGEDREQVEDDLRRIGNAADKMQRLLEELLELSRIGRIVNPPQDVPFEDLAREAVDLVAGQIGERGVRVEISPHAPVLFGDRSRLLEVMQNLVENAVKYLGDQREPRIEIGARCTNNEIVCYVQDNGMGIDPRYHEKIFGLFDKLDPRSAGTGVGLALVKRIVEVHHGRIWVESDGSASGSTFCFTIPTREDSGAE